MKRYLEFLESFAVIVLVLCGLGGFSYHLFRDGGWIELALGDIWELQVQYPLIAIPVTVGAIVMGAMWRERRIARGQRSKLPTYVLYLLMASGAVFIGRLVMYGSF